MVSEEQNIIIIQRTFRKYQLSKNLKEIKTLDLNGNQTFENFTRLIRQQKVIKSFKKFITKLQYYGKLNITPHILISAFMFSYYTNDLLGDKKDFNPVDLNLLNWSNKIVELLNSNISDFKKLFLFIKNYNILFSKWKELDKNRTIQQIIVSYYHRKKHIEDIDDDELVNELEKICNQYVNSILLIDRNFDVEYLENNYELIYNKIIEGYNSINEAINLNFKKAYIDYLTDEINNKNYKVIYDCILDLNDKLNKLNHTTFKYDFLNLLLIHDWSNKLNNYILSVTEIILKYFVNKKLDNSKFIKIIDVNLFCDFSIGLPNIIIELIDKLDYILKNFINS